MKEWLQRIPFRFGPGFPFYLVALVLGLIGTQALRSTVSSMLFILLLLIFPAAVLYLLIGIFFTETYVDIDKTRVLKMEELHYKLEFVNRSPLPFPVLDVFLTLPRKDGIRSTRQKLVLCLLPLGAFHHEEKVSFRFRGTYTIGVETVYVSDLLRLFRFAKRENLDYSILVYPRKLNISEERRSAETDSASFDARQKTGLSTGQIGNVREYREGDLLKNVHWKLSAKRDDLLVKEYQTDQDQHAYILADFSRREENLAPLPEAEEKKPEKKKEPVKNEASVQLKSEKLEGKSERLIRKQAKAASKRAKALWVELPETVTDPEEILHRFRDEINERMADGVAEIATARLIEKLREGHVCHLVWYDQRKAEPLRHHIISTIEEIENVWNEFATTPVCDEPYSVDTLIRAIEETQNRTIHLVSGRTEEKILHSVEQLPLKVGTNAGNAYVEWLLYSPEEVFASPAERMKTIAIVQSRLRSAGVEMKVVHSVDMESELQAFSTLA